jgi:hypothetical protein
MTTSYSRKEIDSLKLWVSIEIGPMVEAYSITMRRLS